MAQTPSGWAGNMAEKEQEEKKDPPAEASGTDEKPKKKRKLVLLLGIGGIGLAAAGGGGFFVMKTLSGGQKELAAEPLAADAHAGEDAEHADPNTETAGATESADGHTEEKATGQAEEDQGKDHQNSAEKAKDGDQSATTDAAPAKSKGKKTISDENSFGETFEIPKMELNVGNPLEYRFLRFSVSLEYHGGEEQAEELEKRLPQMRDIIISLIGRKTRMELLSPEGKENLRKQLKNTFNEVFEKPITNVYFTSFLVE